MIELSENNESSVENQKQTFICHICEEKFEDLAFEVHFPTCVKSLSTSRGLKHANTVHQTHKDCKCDFCGKSFTQPRDLKIHIQAVHEGHKDYKCASCGKSFSSVQYLKKHKHKKDKGQKDNKCENCGKSFSEARNLKIHIHTVHEGYKDH